MDNDNLWHYYGVFPNPQLYFHLLITLGNLEGGNTKNPIIHNNSTKILDNYV